MISILMEETYRGIAHIIGADDITKKSLIAKLEKIVNVVDIGDIQKNSYGCSRIKSLKKKWEENLRRINAERKIAKESGLDNQNLIERLKKENREITKEIQATWKEETEERMKASFDGRYVVFFGYHLFPKDYRIKLSLDVPKIGSFSNHIIFNMDLQKYISNQIYYYLKTYERSIVNGTFPLELLDTNLLADKYTKICRCYENSGYQYLEEDDLLISIREMIAYLEATEVRPSYYYLILPYRTGNRLVIESQRPVEVFETKEMALADAQKRMKTNSPAYIYRIEAVLSPKENRYYLSGTYFPLEEESLLLSSVLKEDDTLL